MQPSGLTVHILHHNIVDLSQSSAVFQNFPWLIGVIMNLDQGIVSDRKQTVSRKIFRKICVVIEMLSFDQKLCVIPVLISFP